VQLDWCIDHLDAAGDQVMNIDLHSHFFPVDALQNPGIKERLPKRPSEYLKRMYFDTIVHSSAALQYLVRVVGADRVVVGTDFPMAMGDFKPVANVKELDLSIAERELILGGNAARAWNF
jgi:predicted TIM-barrel fold metal-dependent hydrolase